MAFASTVEISSMWSTTSSTVQGIPTKTDTEIDTEDFKRQVAFGGLKIVNVKIENELIIITLKAGRRKYTLEIDGNLELKNALGKIINKIIMKEDYPVYDMPYVDTFTGTNSFPLPVMEYWTATTGGTGESYYNWKT